MLVLAPGGQPRLSEDWTFALAVVVPLAATFMFAMAVFSWGLEGDLAARRSTFPSRLFVLPATSAALVGWRRTLNVPRLVVTTPYLVFAAVVVLTFGVTFANVGNLGILVRQRSLVLPLLVLLWAVPPLTGRSGSGHGRRPASTRPSWVVATDEATV